jgi:predicted amidohydrolase
MPPSHKISAAAAKQPTNDDATTAVAVSKPTSVRIAAVQPQLRDDDVHPLDAARSVIDLMRREVKDGISKDERKIDLFCLPELCPIGYSEHTFQNYLDSDDLLQNIKALMADFARECKVYVCYGTIGPKMPSETQQQQKRKRTIRQVVVNDLGEEIASYDKIFLCDYGDCAETRFFVPGSDLCSFDCCGFRFGVIICSDMRYPNLSRQLSGSVEHQVDLILQPAAFSRDVSFRTWKSFRETRAVENGVYFAGVNYCGELFGETSINPPWIDEENEPTVLGTEEGTLIFDIERSALDCARKDMPFYRQLRRDLAG